MTVKELVKKLVNLPTDIEKSTIIFQEGKLVVTDINSSDKCGCYLVE